MAKRIDLDDALIVAAYGELKSARKVGMRLGIGATTVARRLAANDVLLTGVPGIPRKLPATIRAEYESGMSMNAIARKYSASLPTVAEALERAGFTPRARGARRHELQSALIAKVVKAYAELGSQEKAAKLLGITQTKVSRYLRAGGVVVRVGGLRKGGKIRTGTGRKYIAVYVPRDNPMSVMASRVGGPAYVMEHRLVVARWLGRPLESHETVHHINGDTEDNRLENLQLRSKHHGAGVVHRCRACGSTDIESARLQ